MRGLVTSMSISGSNTDMGRLIRAGWRGAILGNVTGIADYIGGTFRHQDAGKT